MSEPKFGFFFPEASYARIQGATSSDEEHFKGTSLAESLVRELGQNSLDAVDPEGDGVVKLEFELLEVNRNFIPDVDNLQFHIEAADEFTKNIDKRNTRLRDASKAIDSDSLMVLRVGDYGTLGLGGNEKRSKTITPLVALTRGAGVSAGKSGSGGSFGLGSSVGTLASSVHTVFWTTLPKGEAEVVFAGFSQLATHEDEEGNPLGAEGFFIDKNDKEDFTYLRSPGPIGPFSERFDVGTDVFILGYKDHADFVGLEQIRLELIRSFLVAIHRGKLQVTGKTQHGQWELNKETLERYVYEMEDVRPFYQALVKDEPYVEDIDGLGQLKLFMNFDDTLEKKLNTIAVRKPLMRIRSFRSPTIPKKYAAIMECSNDEGNEVLRSLESPRHDNWEESRADHGKKTLNKIRKFIRNGLESQLEAETGDELIISGLGAFLPDFIKDQDLGKVKFGSRGKPKNGPASREESSSVQGEENVSVKPVVKNSRKTVKYTMGKRGKGGSNEDGIRGKDVGGSKTRNSRGGNVPTKGDEGNGNVDIPADSIHSRIWTDTSTGDVVMRLRADKPVIGKVTLCVLGAGGETDEKYLLPIQSVIMENSEGSKQIKFQGNQLIGVQLTGKSPSCQLRIRLLGGRRYSLAVI